MGAQVAAPARSEIEAFIHSTTSSSIETVK
jgi:hypothetical protein